MSKLGIFMLGCITGILGTLMTLFSSDEEETNITKFCKMSNKDIDPHAEEEIA